MKTFKITILSTILALFLGGCLWVNERGISTSYYNSCKEYYDAAGIYRKSCDENLIDWGEWGSSDASGAQEASGEDI